MPAGSLTLVRAPTKPTRVRGLKVRPFRTVHVGKTAVRGRNRKQRYYAPTFKNKVVPFPQLIRNVPMRYSANFGLTVGGAGVFGTEQVFRLNSTFDPDFSGVGAQPYGRDTLATLYHRYKVKWVDIKVEFDSPSIATPIDCAIQLRNAYETSTLTGKTIGYVREIPNMMSKRMISDDTARVILSKRISIAKVLGIKKGMYDADVGIFDALVGGNPNATDGTAYLSAAISDPAGGAGATCGLTVSIVMYTDWYNRKILAQS